MPTIIASLSRRLLVLVCACICACTTGPRLQTAEPAGAERLADFKLIAFNDFHGALLPPQIAITAPAGTTTVRVPAGGAAYLASAIQTLRGANPRHAVVSAGDLIGATPLVSALFLDEPTIEVFNAVGLDFNAVGNHEFDRGQAELLRLQNGGCSKFTLSEPCRNSPSFSGARFGFLAANVLTRDGKTLFPATGIKRFDVQGRQLSVGFIGLTLKGTPSIVTPAGVAGLAFLDEAETINAHATSLKAQGVQVVVAVLHEGGQTSGGYNDPSCPGLSGAIVPILDQIDESVDVVISGHTHRAYICDYVRRLSRKPVLVTSAGFYGTLLTDVDLTIDLHESRVVSRRARNIIVQSEPFAGGNGQTVTLSNLYPVFAKDPQVDAIVQSYAKAAAPLTQRVIGRLSSSILRTEAASFETPLGNLIADAQLAATRGAGRGDAQVAFMNPGGVRADLVVPASGGTVTYGQIFSVQPFGNSLVVKTLTGLQIKALLEQQFTGLRPRILFPSAGFTYQFDLSQPPGSRVSAMALDGKPVVPAQAYRVTMNSFLATGGDGFTVFNEGTDAMGGDLDVDALEAYLRSQPEIAPPSTDRVKRL